MGQLAGRTPHGPGARLSIECTFPKLELGESISVDGVCLTVDALTPRGFELDASGETLSRTTLGAAKVGASVNLERALASGERFGGHIVTGHVDGEGRLAEQSAAGDAVKMVFRAPSELLRFIAPKGSITVSGVSLTVNACAGDTFEVMIIPHTLKKTSLGALRAGDAVNLEVDILARYVARLLEAPREPTNAAQTSNAEWMERLRRAGML
jgi:riboflavin synthase